MPDPYTYPGTNILINKFDIRDGQLLTEKENDLVYINLVTAEQYLSGKEFTVDLLKKLHYYLFGDIYEWAGQFRTINIRKAERVLDGMSVEYTDYTLLEKETARIIAALQNIECEHLETEDCADTFTKCFAELWKLHPFREGNTRTITTFMLSFLGSKNIDINVALFSEYSSYVRDSLVMASIQPYQEYQHLYKIILDAMTNHAEPERMDNSKRQDYSHINDYDVKEYHYELFETEE